MFAALLVREPSETLGIDGAVRSEIVEGSIAVDVCCGDGFGVLLKEVFDDGGLGGEVGR